MASKSGAWISFSEDLKSELESKNIECETKFQGEQKLLTHLEENQPLLDFLYEEFKNITNAI